MMSAVTILSKDGRAGEPLMSVVASPTDQIGIKNQSVQNTLQGIPSLHGAAKDTSMVVLDEETIAAVAVQQRLQQVNEVLQRLQSPLQCTICLDLLSAPVTTKCRHSFCLACIHRLLGGVRGSSPCPLCLAPVTKRSLTTQTRMTQIVTAVRAILDSIKKDCGLMATPSKYRPRARPHPPPVEDNSDEEEMDEPRRGTRKRFLAPDTYLDMLPLEPGQGCPDTTADGGRKRAGSGRGRKGGLGGGKKNLSAPDLPSLIQQEASAGFQTGGPSSSFCKLSKSRHAMTASSSSLSGGYEEPIFPRTIGFTSNQPPPAGLPRGRGRGRGRSRPPSIRSTVAVAVEATDDELVSVSQMAEQQQQMATRLKSHDSGSGCDSIATYQASKLNIGKNVMQQKPKEKVAQWLDQSSNMGFKVGLSQCLHDASLTKGNFNSDERRKGVGATELLLPTPGAEVRAHKTSPGQQTSKAASPQMCLSATSNELPYNSQSSTVVFDLASVPTDLNSIPLGFVNNAMKRLTTTLLDDFQEMELPDIESITGAEGVIASSPPCLTAAPCSSTAASTPMRGLVAAAAACDVSAISGSQDAIPDSCPVVTKDAFDVLVDTARTAGMQQYQLRPSGPAKGSTLDKDESLDDVYFFRTPADGLEDKEMTGTNAVAKENFNSKKRTFEESELPSISNKKSKLSVETESRCHSSASTPSVSKTQKMKVSNSTNHELKKVNSKLGNKKCLLDLESHSEQVKSSLLPSCEAMPPPPAPVEGVSIVGTAARRLRPSKAATKTNIDANLCVTSATEEVRLSAERTRNTRYASQLKKQLCEPPKLVATSVGIKDTKSPGWSHVVGAKKDLKTRHVGLNITGGECKLEITKLDGSVKGEKDGFIAHVHRTSSTIQVLSSGESSLEIDDQTQKFDVEHLDSRPGNLQQVQKLKRLVKSLGHDNTSKANEDESNSSDSCDSNNSVNSEGHEPTAAQMAAESRHSKNGLMGLSSKGELGAVTDDQLTSVPETQMSVHSPVSNCLLGGAKDTESPGHNVEHPVSRNVFQDVPLVDGFRVPNTSVEASSKYVEGHSVGQLETAVKSKTNKFQEHAINGDGHCIEDVGGNEAIHCQQVEGPDDTAGGIAPVAGVDAETGGGSEDMAGFTEPVRRTVRSGKLRRETRSLRPTSSSSTTSSVKSKLRSVKSSSSTGSIDAMPARRTAEKPLVSAPQTKLRSSLRSCEIHPTLITESVSNVTSTQTSSDIGAVVNFPPESCNMITASASNVPSTGNGVPSQTTFISKPSTSTAYCDTEATKFTSLATLSSPNELISSSKVLTSFNDSGQHEPQGKQSSTLLAGRSVGGCFDTHHRRAVVLSEEDSEGLNFEEQTIIPTVYKNKRLQADLSVPRAHVAVQCEPRVPDTRNVSVQCDRPRHPALDCGMQTETGTASVGVQAQLAPHHLYVHGVIPYAAMGPNCSDRCAGGGTPSLLQVAGLQSDCLHAVPCSLYQAMIGMLHLAQPNPTCCHHIHQDATHVKEVGKSPDRSESSANPALAIPVESSDGPHDKTSLDHHQPKQSSIPSIANAKVVLHGAEVPASAICDSSDSSVCAVADRLLVSGGPTRRSYRKKLHEAAAARGVLIAQGASYTSGAAVPVPTGSATLPPSGSKRKGEDSGENGKSILKSCSVRLFSPKKGELEALSSLGTFPSTVIVDHSKDTERPEKAALGTKLLQGDDDTSESLRKELSSEIPYLLESGSLQSAKLAQNQSKILSHNIFPHKSQNSSSSQASVSLLEGNSNLDAKASSVEMQGFAKTSASTGPSLQSRLTRQNSKGAEKNKTDSLAATFSPRRKKAALEADEAIEDVASSGPDDGVVAASRGEKENRMKGAERSSGRPRRRPLQLQQVEPCNTDLLKEENYDKAKPPKVGAALQGSKQLFSSADSSSLAANAKISIVKSRTNLFESISDSRNARVTAGKRFKRIRTFDNYDSSSEDEVPKKKPNAKQTLVSFTIGSCANSGDVVSVTNTRNDDAYQKNSEELRLDQFDDGLFEYFGLNKKKTENSSSVSTSKRNDLDLKNQKSPNVVDMHTSFDELPELGNSEDVASDEAGNSKDARGTACDDDEDEIPGTAEVLKNVAADIARIRKMRESTVKNIKMEKGSTASDDIEDKFLSQETVVLSSTNGSVHDSDLHNRYNLTRPDKEAEDSQTCLSATNRTAFTTQTGELFSRCARSLRKVEQRLHSSQDSDDASSSMTAENGCRAGLDAEASVRSSSPCEVMAGNGSRCSSDSDDREQFKRPDASLCKDVELKSISELGPAGGGEDNSLNHLSMMSTQSEVVSTQYRNRVQNEVDLLKAKMLALQRELLNCKPSAVAEPGLTTDGADPVTRVTGSAGPNGDSKKTGQKNNRSNPKGSIALGDDAGTINSNAATSKKGFKMVDKEDGVSGASTIATEDEESDMFCSQQSTAPEAGASGRRVIQRGAQKAETALQSSQSGRLVLVCTGLSADESALVIRLARIMRGKGAEVLRSWRSDVTHVIVRCSPDSTTDRTLKYLYGVASGCWVLSIAWVSGCLQEGRLMPEGDFEALDSTGVPGPYRGRLNRSRLFKGAALCCLPPFNDVTNEQLQDLVRLCGGTLVSSPDQFQSSSRRPGDSSGLQLIVMQAGEDGDGASRQRAQDLGALHGRLVVAGDWLIECVAMYARIGMLPYVLSAPDDNLRLASGVSDGLMQETQDF